MKKIKPGILLTVIILAGFLHTYAQDKTDTSGPAKSIINFTVISTSDDSLQLKAIVSVRRESGITMLVNAPVKFSITGPDSQSIPVGEAKTDVHGIAQMKVSALGKFATNDQKMITFTVSYTGNAKYEASNGEFAIRPAKLNISFYEEDSVRYVKVKGVQWNEGKEVPLNGLEIPVSVTRMLSLLKVAGVTLDSTGIGTAEFPKNIIGDPTGKLTVVASLDEHEIYGFMRAQAENNWGIPKHLISPDRPSRELWTPIAPLWMIITLIIMLSGVWGHYIYAVVQLVGIHKSSKKNKPEPSPEIETE